MRVAYFTERLCKDKYVIDFAKLTKQNDCKGIYAIEVKPIGNKSLSINSYDTCTTDKPFKLESPVPMVSGSLEFEGDNVLFVVRMVLE